MKKLCGIAAVWVLLMLAAGAAAEVLITTADGNGADGGVSNDGNQGPSYVLGTATNVQLRRHDGTRAKAVLLRFDLSSVLGEDLSDAVLSITTTSTSNRERTINIYGLKDGEGENWEESTLCYNTAPGLLPANLGYISIDATQWTLLGTIRFAAGPTTNSATVDLSPLLAEDTNGLISLLLYSATSDSSQSWYCAMKEYAPTYPSPTLRFPHALPIGSSYPQPEDQSTVIDTYLPQLCWKNRLIDRYQVWFGAADANELDYQARLSPIAVVNLPDPNQRDVCVDIPSEMLPLAAPQVYTWAVEGYVYPAEDPQHLGEPNQLLTVSVWRFTTKSLPVVANNPADQYKFVGQSASFSAGFQSAAPVTGAVWYKVGTPDTPIDPQTPGVEVTIVDEGSGRYTVTLTLDAVQSADEGAYYCVAQNSSGLSDPTAAAYLILKRMLAHWAFDGDATDETGTYNGTLYGEPNFVVDGSRHALAFDGVNDYVQLPAGFENFRAGITVAMWVNPTTAGNYARFLDLGNGAPSDNIIFTRAGTTTWLHFESFNGTTSGGFVSLGSGTLTENNWQFFAVTVDENGQAVLYKNGFPIASSTIAKPNVVVRANNYIGATNWTSYALYNGLIDDLKIYNYGLSEDAIAQLYADVAGDYCRFRPDYDFNNNCLVDLADFAAVASQWLECGLYPESACP
ncbi:MAG TPA: DNRLRE domain-containing protein [Anaerohalosphaeraceae bacterium]|nr:DNRLRE domain-containing protein [Anaerohalosphaeraceae bacterium]